MTQAEREHLFEAVRQARYHAGDPNAKEHLLVAETKRETPIIDAAIVADARAVCFQREMDEAQFQEWLVAVPAAVMEHERSCILSVLRSACPKEPDSDVIEAMAEAIACAHMDGAPEYTHARWVLFTDTTRCRYRVDALAAYRAQPLWIELWSDK